MARSSDSKKLALWQGRFRRFLDSGLAVARFCAAEDVSESSFYYWQKKLGPRALRRSARAKDHGACAETRDTNAEDHGAQALQRSARADDRSAEDRNACSKDRKVFQPVTVVPGVFGVVVRLPDGTQIEVGTEHLDAIRAVVAEAARVDRGGAACSSSVERNVSSDNQVTREASSDNQAIRKTSSGNQVIRQRGGAASC